MWRWPTLSRASALAQRLREQFPVAMIDEFQDTSPLQFRIFDRIYRTAENRQDAALLLIGDPKQSIYGFPRRRHPQLPGRPPRHRKAATMCWAPTSAPPKRWWMWSTAGSEGVAGHSDAMPLATAHGDEDPLPFQTRGRQGPRRNVN